MRSLPNNKQRVCRDHRLSGERASKTNPSSLDVTADTVALRVRAAGSAGTFPVALSRSNRQQK